ncbi:MAG: beta-propeller fold lactonase family protein [Spirochaetaceae bacterium]|nr:beta-propeller fold lactonase family protein [Spirochaetaceae bacterium]
MVALAVMVALVFACSREPEQKAFLSISFGQPAPRAFAPSGLDIDCVAIAATGPGGARENASSNGGESVQFSLVPGAWHFDAVAKSSSGIDVAMGSIDLVLAPAERRSATVPLLALGGTGEVLLSWTINGSLEGTLTIAGKLSRAGQEDRLLQAGAGESPLRLEALAAGAWSLELQLVCNGSPICGLADSVLVGAGMETRVEALLVPPEARLSLSFALPLFEPRLLDLEPSVRRIAAGGMAAFRAMPDAQYSWFLDGNRLADTDSLLEVEPADESAGRIDCLEAGASSFPAAASVAVKQSNPYVLGPLKWIETILKEDTPSSSAKYQKALSGLRDITFSPDGQLFLAASKESNALTLYSTSEGRTFFVEGSLSAVSEPRLKSPSRIAFSQDGIFCLAEAEGALYWIVRSANGMILQATTSDPSLAGAIDIAAIQGRQKAYIAAKECDAVMLASKEAGAPSISVTLAAGKDGSSLSTFDSPSCLALSPDGATLVVGTSGDDALYVFSRDPVTDGLTFSQRIDKSELAPLASLSDPCSISFSPDGASIYVLSYYGKAVFRLDRGAGSGPFAPSAAARSGVDGIAGFAYPKRLSVSADGSLLAVAGGGAADGIALFGIAAPGELTFHGAAIADAANLDAVPSRPVSAVFAPAGRLLAIGAEDRMSLFDDINM